MAVYVTYKARSRDPFPYSFIQKWGPTMLVWMSLPFILADPVRHVMNDKGTWEGCQRKCHELWPTRCHWSSSEYECTIRAGKDTPDHEFNCKKKWEDSNGYMVEYNHCIPTSKEEMAHLTPIGILFTIFFTYFGFLMFMVGSLWSANIVQKCVEIRHKWRVLRGHSEDSDN